LTALAQVIGRWASKDTLLINVIRDGRQVQGFDYSRSIGNFAVEFPVVLELANRSLAMDIVGVKRQLRRVPQHGIGYGLLRYVNQGTQPLMAELSHPDLSVSFAAPLQSVDSRRLRLSTDLSGASMLNRKNGVGIEVQCAMVRSRLQFRFSFDTRKFHKETIRHIARQFMLMLEALVAHCKSSV
jgi:non-ribosomal peptide synthase protein (TIGR01720 family)